MELPNLVDIHSILNRTKVLLQETEETPRKSSFGFLVEGVLLVSEGSDISLQVKYLFA